MVGEVSHLQCPEHDVTQLTNIPWTVLHRSQLGCWQVAMIFPLFVDAFSVITASVRDTYRCLLASYRDDTVRRTRYRVTTGAPLHNAKEDGGAVTKGRNVTYKRR